MYGILFILNNVQVLRRLKDYEVIGQKSKVCDQACRSDQLEEEEVVKAVVVVVVVGG